MHINIRVLPRLGSLEGNLTSEATSQLGQELLQAGVICAVGDILSLLTMKDVWHQSVNGHVYALCDVSTNFK